VKQIRKRLTYANVMSSIAVFFVLGGGAAYAAKKIGSNQLKPNSVTTAKIKKEAVTTAKIKKDAVTGAKVKESTLGTVPSATNAGAVNGQTATKVFAKLNIGQSNVQIASIAGFTITATCNGNVEELTLHAPSNVASALEAQGDGNDGDFFEQNNGLGNISISLNESGLIENDRGNTSFSAATTTGTVISGNLSYEDSETFEKENICAVFGEVISG
jgi:hypothetical protein